MKQEVLLISQDDLEITTEIVMDWIYKLGGIPFRFNGDDLFLEKSQIKISNNSLVINGTEMFRNYHSIWNRRWSTIDIQKGGLPTNNSSFNNRIFSNISKDIISIKEYIINTLTNLSQKNLTTSSQININKLSSLDCAKEVGFTVPLYITTNSKVELLNFSKKCKGSIITKDISTPFYFLEKNKNHIIYANRLETKDLEQIPEYFGFSFFQEEIKKEYEIRVFYLNGKTYSMAIFSQQNENTKVDYRRYNFKQPNRNVPYRISSELKKKIVLFMKKMNYQTGSFDFIKSNEDYYFLEMNPVGQFGNVSDSCNYNIEKDIATLLLT